MVSLQPTGKNTFVALDEGYYVHSLGEDVLG